MTFDLDLYLQGHSTLFWLGIQHDSIVWVIMRRRGYLQNAGVLVVLVYPSLNLFLMLIRGNKLIRFGVLLSVNTLRPRQNGRRFPDDIFRCIFLNENVWISLHISLKYVPKLRINNIPALVRIMAWRRPGNKPLSEPMIGNSLTHVCVTRPQWVKCICPSGCSFH